MPICARIAAVRRRFPEQVAVTDGQHFYRGFRLASYYLPEYRVLEHGWPEKPPWVLGERGELRFSRSHRCRRPRAGSSA